MNDLPFELVLFDIGGVLIDYSRVFTTVEKEQHIPKELLDKTFDKYDKEITIGTISTQELYLKCISENNLKTDTDYDFLQSWISDYRSIEQTYELVSLTKEKYKVGLLSNIYKHMVPNMINQNLLPQIDYDFLFISCDIGMKKPDVDIYNFILAQTKIQPNKIFFIDDKENYLLTAKNLGWNTFQFDQSDVENSIKNIKTLLEL